MTSCGQSTSNLIVQGNCYFVLVLVLSEAVLVLDFFDYEEEDDDEDELDSSPGVAGKCNARKLWFSYLP